MTKVRKDMRRHFKCWRFNSLRSKIWLYRRKSRKKSFYNWKPPFRKLLMSRRVWNKNWLRDFLNKKLFTSRSFLRRCLQSKPCLPQAMKQNCAKCKRLCRKTTLKGYSQCAVSWTRPSRRPTRLYKWRRPKPSRNLRSRRSFTNSRWRSWKRSLSSTSKESSKS